MKLLYLYVQRWLERGINGRNAVEYNFQTGWRFHCDGTNLTLERTKSLPDKFFCLNDSSSSQVESVSVLIGDNGSGKTSLAKLFGVLFERARPDPKYVCLYLKDNKVYLYENLLYGNSLNIAREVYEELEKVSWGLTRCEDKEHKEYRNPFDIIYYSPYFTTTDLWKGNDRKNFKDISTSHLILSARSQAKGENLADEIRSADKKLVFEFAYEYLKFIDKEIRQVNAVLPLPRYADIRVTGYELLRISEDLSGAQRNRRASMQIANKQLINAYAVLCYDGTHNIVWRFVSELLLARINENEKQGKGDFEDPAIDDLIEICRLVGVEDVLDLPDEVDLRRKMSLFIGGININALSRVIDSLIRLAKEAARGNGDVGIANIKVDLSNHSTLENVLALEKSQKELSEESVCARGLLTINLASMSSGEMAYWTLFSRIYNAIPDAYKAVSNSTTASKKHLLVFLDEVETTLHPDWQRRLVKNILWFFENCTRKLSVQIIFATHSPMILSDIPKGNVVFLYKDRASPSGFVNCDINKMQGYVAEMHNTFGANIYDLYRLAFSLEDGSIGDFARGKLDSLLSDRAKMGVAGIDTRVVDLIGNDAIRRYLIAFY